MKKMDKFSFQRISDNLIDKTFLRVIPQTVTPNQVTITRFILVPIVYWLLRIHQFDWALVIFLVAVSTDFIDGAMARTRNQVTDVGKIIDPIADKLLILSVLLFIGFKLLIVRILVIFIIFELFAVLLGNWFSFAIGKPIGANVFGKIKLVLQAASVGLFLLGMIVGNQSLVRVAVWMLVVGLVFAVAAGLETIRRKALYLKENKIIYSQPD